MNASEIEKNLEKQGWERHRNGTNHVIMWHPETGQRMTIPRGKTGGRQVRNVMARARRLVRLAREEQEQRQQAEAHAELSAVLAEDTQHEMDRQEETKMVAKEEINEGLTHSIHDWTSSKALAQALGCSHSNIANAGDPNNSQESAGGYRIERRKPTDAERPQFRYAKYLYKAVVPATPAKPTTPSARDALLEEAAAKVDEAIAERDAEVRAHLETKADLAKAREEIDRLRQGAKPTGNAMALSAHLLRDLRAWASEMDEDRRERKEATLLRRLHAFEQEQA